MNDKVESMLDIVSSRRHFIGRHASRAALLVAGLLGFSKRAKGGECTIDSYCCHLCMGDTGQQCLDDCAALSGSAHWAWTCPWQGGYMCCYECFWTPSICGASCGACQNAYCSGAVPGQGCTGGICT